MQDTKKGIFLYLWIPFSFRMPQKLQVARCCFVMKEGFSPLGIASEIHYINYCPKGTVKITEKPDEKDYQKNILRRWCPADQYIWHLRGESHKGLYLLFNLFSMEYRNQYFFTQEKSMKPSLSTQLDWYIDVAIRLWNYRILGNQFSETDLRFQNTHDQKSSD